MKEFLLKILGISLSFLVIAIIMEILIRDIPNDYQLKKEYLNNHANEIETLILGSSHSFYGINPTYFKSKTFNASHISQTLNYDFEILQQYHSDFKNLKTIVLPISYFTLFENLKIGSESWRVKNYTIYYEMDSYESLFRYSEVLSNPFRINLKRIILYYLLNESEISCSSLGWGTVYQSKNAQDLIETGKAAAQRHTYFNSENNSYKKIFHENILILNSIANWCKERNVKLILLTPPAYDTYRKNLNSEQLKITIETTQKITTNNNCLYLNLLDDTRFYAKDFYDADHLSEIGAAKLSALVNDLID